MKVLICEDDETLRFCVCEMLKAHGHTVLEASRKYHFHAGLMESPDFIITDGDLGEGLTGLEVLRIAKTLGIPCFLMSGRDEIVTRAKLLGYKAQVKPVDLHVILAIVEQRGAARRAAAQ